MEIPIRFKYLDKLKLYQDYLKKDSMLEKTKSEYWLYEKALLYWAYSRGHQDLSRPLDVSVFLRDVERQKEIPEIIDNISPNQVLANQIKSKSKDQVFVAMAIGNLVVLGFFDKIGEDSSGRPETIVVNEKGYLLGEILYETFECPSFINKNYRKYKIGIAIFWFLFILLLLTSLFVFLNQAVFLGKSLIEFSLGI